MSFITSLENDFEKAGAWFEKLFGKASTWDKAALTAITIAAPLVEGILAVVDEPLELIVAPIITTVETDLTTAATLVSSATANPTLTGALNAVVNNLSGLLEIAEVKNSASVAKITTNVNAVVADIKAVLAALPTA